ncbi:MAG: P-loop NTPase [Ardenticatenaceae bacterium]
MVSKEQIWQALKEAPFPGFKGRNVFGLIKGLEVDEAGVVSIKLAIGHLGESGRKAVLKSVHSAVMAVAGVTSLQAQIVQMAPPQQVKVPRPGIESVIAVGSGKGGVGKSTVAVNLAVGLAQQGLKVGLMDADIFGPNVPRMLGVSELPPKNGARIVPAEVHGVKFVSVGLLVQASKAVVWRGPMTDKILRQFLFGVDWGELDVLVVDMPPGTGDIAISLGKHAEPDGAIVVVTPQGVALDDARKAISMFRRLTIPVLGVVENMSYFVCPDCDSRHHLFGEGGGQRLAHEMDTLLLGQIPMETHVRAGGDDGFPAVLRQESLAGSALAEIAQRVREEVVI